MPSQNPDIRKFLANDIRVELSEEFDRNFERKAFFDRPWPKRNFERKAFFDSPWPKRKRKGRGSLLLASGKLRCSILSKVNPNYSITWSTSELYAAIYNEGGTTKVSRIMKRHVLFRSHHY